MMMKRQLAKTKNNPVRHEYFECQSGAELTISKYVKKID